MTPEVAAVVVPAVRVVAAVVMMPVAVVGVVVIPHPVVVVSARVAVTAGEERESGGEGGADQDVFRSQRLRSPLRSPLHSMDTP